SQYSELSQKATLSSNIQVHFLQMRLASERYLESLDEQYETNYQSSKLAIDELLNNLIQTTTKTDSLASLQLVQD
ncbi:methyl-accepting chemotaxis protein, partial [Vibrio breoganii]